MKPVRGVLLLFFFVFFYNSIRHEKFVSKLIVNAATALDGIDSPILGQQTSGQEAKLGSFSIAMSNWGLFFHLASLSKMFHTRELAQQIQPFFNNLGVKSVAGSP